MHAHLGQILDKRYKKTKTPTATSEKPGAKARYWQPQETHAPPKLPSLSCASHPELSKTPAISPYSSRMPLGSLNTDGPSAEPLSPITSELQHFMAREHREGHLVFFFFIQAVFKTHVFHTPGRFHLRKCGEATVKDTSVSEEGPSCTTLLGGRDPGGHSVQLTALLLLPTRVLGLLNQ